MDSACYPQRLVCFMSDKSVILSASEGSCLCYLDSSQMRLRMTGPFLPEGVARHPERQRRTLSLLFRFFANEAQNDWSFIT